MKNILPALLLAASILQLSTGAAQAQTASDQTSIQSHKSKLTDQELEQMAVVLVDYKNGALDMQKKYEAALEASGWGDLLDTEHLKKDTGFAHSKRILANAKDVVAQYRKKTFSLIDQTEKGFRQIKFTSGEGKAFSAGINKHISTLRSQAQESWNIEGKLVSKVGDMIALLSARKSAWTIEEEQIVFRNERDNEKFQQYISDFYQLLVQQEELKKQ